MKPHRIIGPDDNPYMHRWHILRVGKLPRIYVHKFLRSDDDRALHDHPWWFMSIILKGKYIEKMPDRDVIRKPGSIAFRRATHRHRVVLFNDNHPSTIYDSRTGGQRATCDCDYEIVDPQCIRPVWTLFITGPVMRRWGFWCEAQDEYIYPFGMKRVANECFVPAREFDGCD